MNKKYTQLKYQELLDRLIELAGRLYTGRRTDPHGRNVRSQLEAIQTEIQSRNNFPRNNGRDTKM